MNKDYDHMKSKKNRPPGAARELISRLYFYEKNFSLTAGLEEEFSDRLDRYGRKRAVLWYWHQTFQIIVRNFISGFFRSILMLKNYLKISIRHIFSNKAYSLINIGGLALGLICCFLITLYIRFELSYDDYHKDVDRIYRIGLIKRSPAGERSFAQNSAAIFPLIREEYPQVENAFRIKYEPSILVKYNEKAFYEQRLAYADHEIFSMLRIELLSGEEQSVLNRPGTAVISESTSIRYYGEENPVGKVLFINDEEFEVTGVYRDFPMNTHLKADLLLSFPSFEDNQRLYIWGNTSTLTYIKLSPEVNAELFEEQIRYFVHDHDSRIPRDGHTEFIYFLQPIKDIHLHSNLSYESEPPGNVYYIYLFSAIAVLILFIACFNFMNLTTARSTIRSREVGMRKVIGAQRRQLIFQFISESILMSVIAFLTAVILTILILPYFNEITSADFIYKDLFELQMMYYMMGLIAITGAGAGLYPAFVMSSFKPIQVLKKSIAHIGSGAALRKVLVTAQFAISVSLIICTIVVYKQIDFMKHVALGFEKEQKLIIEFPEGSALTRNYESVKTEFKRHSSITAVSASYSVPGSDYRSLRMFPSDEQEVNSHSVNANAVDHDFLQLFNIEMAAGRQFMREARSDTLFGGFIINEAAVRLFGWSSPETALEKYMWEENIPVIGVMKDYHYRGLQAKVEPLMLYIFPGNYKRLTLSLQTGDISSTMTFIRDKYRELFPDIPFRYSFCDDLFDSQYRVEERIGKIAGIFTFIGIFISCLGLFGLAAFIVERRRKEIGVRKVLGGSLESITILLASEFIKLVGLGTILAFPAGWIVVNSWLQNFAYRTNPGIGIFVFSGALVMLIAVITVSFQTLKAAWADPVRALRYE
ncbi:ABC transporter permease [candidate division KSB1 bacterium]